MTRIEQLAAELIGIVEKYEALGSVQVELLQEEFVAKLNERITQMAEPLFKRLDEIEQRRTANETAIEDLNRQLESLRLMKASYRTNLSCQTEADRKVTPGTLLPETKPSKP